VVADDQTIDRRALVTLLESQRDFEIVGESPSGRDAVSRCERFRPDVVVMSIRLPDLDGVTAISLIRNASPTTHVIALAERSAGNCLVLNPPRRSRQGVSLSGSAGAASAMCTDCLQLAVAGGALGALRRDAEPEQLFRAVRAVAQGNAWYEPSTASAILKRAMGAGTNGAHALSVRELDVAGLISDGLSNKEIGRALGISEPTVKKHVGHLLTKLGLQDRLQVGMYIVRNPLLFEKKVQPR
jgi:DNA-binding NarL/FixJ family response regulator